ncbi:hypothetical protein GCM10029976_071210 [Kribbella albertanoniae]|uniref:Uncharacterized protein n=1 Tax=Kribbella albertanoniae TaxID=1266829 RepID=A0A4R4PJV0_9ACTN|nr:hypothetical protein [Kribbella albertanoniae]TDC22199.1 hypothetical protein E1261_31550 [Kribbella albertanoniae]
MIWQLWVAIGLVAAAVLLFAATRMRHAQHVFDDITQVERPAHADELAHRRTGRVTPETGRHRKHG